MRRCDNISVLITVSADENEADETKVAVSAVTLLLGPDKQIVSSHVLHGSCLPHYIGMHARLRGTTVG